MSHFSLYFFAPSGLSLSGAVQSEVASSLVELVRIANLGSLEKDIPISAILATL